MVKKLKILGFPAADLSRAFETEIDGFGKQNSLKNAEREARNAENVRYGQNVSEQAVGVISTSSDSSAEDGTKPPLFANMMGGLIFSSKVRARPDWCASSGR